MQRFVRNIMGTKVKGRHRFSKPVFLACALLFGAIGAVTIFNSFAATSYQTVQPESATRTGNLRVAADSQASGGSYVEFGTSAEPQDPGGSSPTHINGVPKPGPSNTGPTNRAILQQRGSLNITTNGTVVENVAVTGTITISANNVTLRNFTVDATGKSYGIQTGGSSGVVIEHGEIYNMNSAGIFGMGFTARYLNIHDSSGDGIKAQGSSGGPVLVEKTWMHHLGKGEGAHADFNQTRKANNDIVFRYNNCDIPVNVPDPYKSNACFMLQEAEGPVKSFLIEYNWLNGGNYTVYCTDTTTVRNNRIGRDYRHGIKRSCDKWTNNVWDDNGQPAN